jgi:cell cycle sensor histidine kinase DivJ
MLTRVESLGGWSFCSVFLIKRSWRRLAELFRPKAHGGEPDLIWSAPLRLEALFAIVIVLGLGIAERVGLIGGQPWFVAACVSAVLLMISRRPGGSNGAKFENFDRFRTLSEATGDLIMEHDSSGRVLSIACEARPHLQTEAQNLLGTGFYNRIHIADRPKFLHVLASAAGSGETVSVSLRLRSGAVQRSAGFDEPVYVWMETRLRRIPRRLDAGSRREAVILSVTRDVSSAGEVQQRLESARAETALALSLKDRLLANVSHELRTPLNAILGFSEILADIQLAPSEPAKRVEYAAIIHSSAEHLLSVVNLVLDMSKIEAGKFQILAEPFELEPLVKDCCDMLRLKAENGKVALLRAESDFSLEVVADKRACRQILLNLLANAVKFTPPEGRVTVGAFVADSMVHIHVSDTGIGIAAQDLARLGEPFYQVRSNYDRSYEGAGLGLSLVRGLVGLHGGTICLESSPGVGTRVTVRLPLDCRLVARAGAEAPRLQTFASVSASVEPDAPPFDSSAFPPEERKIA